MKNIFHILAAPFYLLYKLYFITVFFITLLLLYPFFKILLKTKRYNAVFSLLRFWSKLICFLTLITLNVKQEAPFPKSPYVFCSNHASYIDTVMIYRVIKDYFITLGKAELLTWPIFRIFFYDMNIPVYRSSHRSAHKAFLKSCEAIEKGACLGIFPEGGIPIGAPKMGKFKMGAFKLAIEKQVPIVPITFVNNHRRFGEPTNFLRPASPGKAEVYIHKAIETKGMTDKDLLTLRDEVFNIISTKLQEYER